MTPDETVMVDEVTAKVLRKLDELGARFAEATGSPNRKSSRRSPITFGQSRGPC